VKLKKVHFLSGLIISVFIGVHLFNHLAALYGADSHLAVMDSLRVVYRNVVVETLLMLVVLVQVVSGIKLFFKTRKWKKRFFEKLQIWSGLYLAFFLLVHVGAVMAGRFVMQLDTNFYFGVAGLNTFPLSLFFVPYYALAVLAFFGHIASIHSQKMRKKLFGLSVPRQSRIILGLGVVCALVILYALTNGFAGVEIPEAYDVMLGK